MVELTKARVNGCLSKNRCPNRERAEFVKRVENEKRGVKLGEYHCQFCYGFHLTKKPKGFVKNRNQKNRNKLYL